MTSMHGFSPDYVGHISNREHIKKVIERRRAGEKSIRVGICSECGVAYDGGGKTCPFWECDGHLVSTVGYWGGSDEFGEGETWFYPVSTLRRATEAIRKARDES